MLGITSTFGVLDELKEDIHAVLLNPNDSKAYPEDSPAKMLECKSRGLWPYVYDEHQTIAKQYQAVVRLKYMFIQIINCITMGHLIKQVSGEALQEIY